MYQPDYNADTARVELFNNTITAVAAELGGFHYVPDVYHPGHWCAVGHLYSSAERATLRVTLNLSTSTPTHRAEVTGVYPRTTRGSAYVYENEPKSGFIITRPAADVAADIRRRFMPKYLAYNAEAITYVQSWQRAEEAESKALEEMREAGFKFAVDSREGYQPSRVGAPEAACCVYGTRIDMKLRHLTTAQAAHVADYIRRAA